MIFGEDQFLTFLLCVGTGIVGGVIYELFLICRILCGCEKKKRKWLSVAIDLSFWICFSALCVYTSVYFRFSDLRVYRMIGYFLGFIIYLKILHRIVAFLEKVCYNIGVKVWKSIKSKKNSFRG